MKLLRSAHPGPRLAVIAILGVLLARPTVAQSTTPTFVQAATFSTGSRVSTVPGSLRFMDDTGDIALYYRENSQAAPGGLTITVTVSSSAPAYLQGTVADYSGIALAGALDQIASARGIGTTVDTGATAAVDAGELVFAALITGDDPRSVTPGSSAGVQYTPRAQNSNGSAFAEDITSSAAGAQQGTATLGAAANWIAVCAVFHAAPTTAPRVPSAPVGLEATSVASTRVALSWSPSGGSVAGYAVYRNGTAIGTTRPDTTIFLDPNVTPATDYTYSVDAFDTANDHSAQSAPLAVTTPALSPEFVQGAAASPPDPSTSYTLTLTQPVAAGDLLVGCIGPRDHGVGVRSRLSAGGGRGLSTRGSARPGGGIARHGNLRHRGSDRHGAGRRAGRRGHPHRRPTRFRGRRKQPEGAVPHRRAERQRLLRPRGHPVQRRRPAGGEPDLGLGLQLGHGAGYLPVHRRVHDDDEHHDAADHHIDVHHHDHDPLDDDEHRDHAAADDHDHDHDPHDDDEHRTTHHDHRTADDDDANHDDAAGDQHHVEVHDDHHAGADNDDDHHAVACVRRAVSPLPRKLPARVDVHGQRPPGDVLLSVRGALGR